jgi:flagellar P-ring protein FlgI
VLGLGNQAFSFELWRSSMRTHAWLIGLAIALGIGLAFIPPRDASAEVRIKDITDVAGARSNQLVGFGLVVGLDGTGSRSTFTQQIAVDMLQRLGVTAQIFSQLPSDAVLRSTNISAVMVVADLGPFARRGTRIDLTVSSIDDARSLQGGTLLLTPLRGVDGQVYAVGQGAVSVGGFSVAGAAAGIQKNQLNTGRVPNGAMVEKEAPGEIVKDGKLQLLLKDADFNTARLVAKAINQQFPSTALATDAGSVMLCPPLDPNKSPVQLLAEIGLLEIKPDMPARVVINERTGTVVAGEHVTLGTTAVAHGNLFISTTENPQVSQPNAFASGATAIVPRTQTSALEQRARLALVPKSTTVADVARSLNALGVSPRDLISIFQSLKQAGALHAELVII